MNFILGDYFKYMLLEEFDGVITDIPWEAKVADRFDYAGFMKKADADTVDNAFLITFCNMLAMHDLINNAGR